MALVGSFPFWPLVGPAEAQTGQWNVRVLMGWSEADPQYRSRVAALIEGLAALGWRENKNLALDVYWTEGNVDRAGALAEQLSAGQPDVLVAASTPSATALHLRNKAVPIIFLTVSDPVGAGFVKSLQKPSGNMTGFINIEASMAGKWLEMLMEIAPNLRRVVLMFNPETSPGGGTFFGSAFEAAARTFNIEASMAPVRSDHEIQVNIETLGRERGGILLASDSFLGVHRRAIIAATRLHNVASISDLSIVPREGGLIAYGPDYNDIFRRCATYIDRILKGANPADLPVEVPSKFELVLNIKTAGLMGLTIPTSMLARADEVID